MADSDLGFSIDGWEDFVNRFASLVDKWAEKKAELLKNLGTAYQKEIIPHVPVDTSTLAYSIKVFGDGIPQDYVEVGTHIKYALFVNDGHVQHKRLLPVESLSTNGKKKPYHTVKGKGGKMYVTLSERYIQGAHFMENGFEDAKPKFKSLVDSFMLQLAREVEGGSL